MIGINEFRVLRVFSVIVCNEMNVRTYIAIVLFQLSGVWRCVRLCVFVCVLRELRFEHEKISVLI